MNNEKRGKMPPMSLNTTNNNKKWQSEKLAAKKQDYTNKKIARIDERSFIYVPANATQKEVEELVTVARNKFQNLKYQR